MKKFQILFLILSFSSLMLQGQERKSAPNHEIYASIGFAADESFSPECEPVFSGLNTSLQFKNQKYTNPLSLGYMINLSKFLGIGLSYSSSEMDADLWLNAAANKTASVDAKYNIFMLNARYKWLVRGNFTLYSRVGLGSIKMNVSDPIMEDLSSFAAITGWEDKSGFAWQAVPVGLQYVLFNRLGLFAEGGIGVESCCSMGVKLLF